MSTTSHGAACPGATCGRSSSSTCLSSSIPRASTLQACCWTSRLRIGDRPCVHTGDGAWTYHELLERSNRIARVLAEDMAIVPGNRVLLHGLNGAELIALWLGVLKAGAVAVATMPLLRAGELAEIIERAQVTHALADARCAAAVARGPAGAARAPRAAHLRSGGRAGIARRGQADGLHERRHGERRRRPDRIHVRHDGEAQGLHSFSPGHPGDLRHLRQVDRPTPGRRCVRRDSAACIHVRPRRPRSLPASLRSLDRADRAPGTDAVFEAVRRHRVTTLFTARPPTGRCYVPAQSGRPCVAPHMRRGGRNAARGRLQRVVRQEGDPHPRRDRFD